MGRRPLKPWYWAARDAWVVQKDGRRVPLAKGKAGKREAFAAFHKLMAEAGQPAPELRAVPLVGELVVDYLADLRRRRAADEVDGQTRGDAMRRLAGFAEMHGDTPADRIKPHHVDAWLATKTKWGKTSRHDGVGAVKSVFKWATRKGHLDRNPLAEVEKPPRAGRRDAPLPDADALARFFAAVRTPELADLLAFLQDTGCRPKEARTVEARHLDAGHGLAVLPKHKTARKTGKPRVLYLKGRAGGIAARLAAAHPEGPIFRNTKGQPWTKDALVSAVTRARDRAGVGQEVIAYAFRHWYITAGAAKGVAAPLLAELAGHSDLRMISTYSHLSGQHAALGEAAARIVGGGEAAE